MPARTPAAGHRPPRLLGERLCAPDPWAYGSAYEQLKYERTLSLLPSGTIDRALELACSEGWFSVVLAPAVGHLTASDISETALGRARQRCARFANVDYRRLDFFDEPLPEGSTCSSAPKCSTICADETELRRIAAKLAAALKPGGHLLTAHARLLKDDPTRSGFDWDGAFGVDGIATALTATPGLALVRSMQAELYRIDLYRRLHDGESAPPPRSSGRERAAAGARLRAQHRLGRRRSAARRRAGARERRTVCRSSTITASRPTARPTWRATARRPTPSASRCAGCAGMAITR